MRTPFRSFGYKFSGYFMESGAASYNWGYFI